MLLKLKGIGSERGNYMEEQKWITVNLNNYPNFIEKDTWILVEDLDKKEVQDWLLKFLKTPKEDRGVCAKSGRWRPNTAVVYTNKDIHI